MATWEDVRRIALALPETGEHSSRGHRTWRVKDRLFVWERSLHRRDLEELGDGAPDGPFLAARVEGSAAKQALIADGSGVYFTISHFDGYAAILARLAEIAPDELTELIVEAWLSRAPPRLARAYIATHLADVE